MIDLRRMYRMLKKWFNDTFGPDPDPMTIILKLQEEVNELNMRVQTYSQWETHENRLAVLEEIADVTMVLFRLSQRYGFCYDNFVDAIVTKHNVNRKREWEQLPDGTWKHIPEKKSYNE